MFCCVAATVRLWRSALRAGGRRCADEGRRRPAARPHRQTWQASIARHGSHGRHGGPPCRRRQACTVTWVAAHCARVNAVDALFAKMQKYTHTLAHALHPSHSANHALFPSRLSCRCHKVLPQRARCSNSLGHAQRPCSNRRAGEPVNAPIRTVRKWSMLQFAHRGNGRCSISRIGETVDAPFRGSTKRRRCSISNIAPRTITRTIITQSKVYIEQGATCRVKTTRIEDFVVFPRNSHFLLCKITCFC